MLKKIIRTRTMGFPARTVCFCVFTISSAVLPFAACISIIQEEYNIIANRPLKLVCNIESTITNAVTIRTPDNSEAVACTPTVVTPPNPASCSSPGTVYTGSINETANTVTLITNMLPGDVNGTWTCSHGSNFEPFVFPNPIPCFTTESLVLTPSSFPGNITKDSTTLSLSVIYSCINVDITFKWILKAGTAHEYTSPSVTKDSSPCTDTATCTGVNAYTQVISSDAIFQFAKDQGLQGGYELTVEAHSSKGITALKSQSIVYFEFSLSTDACDFNYWNCIGYILAAVFIASCICTTVVVVWWKIKGKEKKAKNIICWIAEHRFCCCGQHIFCCCSQKIKSFCEKYKKSRIRGARVMLLADVFVIGMVVSIAVWLFAVFIVIFTYCVCKDWLVKFAVVGISLAFSLLASLICTAIVLIFYGIALCCKNNVLPVVIRQIIKAVVGDDVNILEKRTHTFKPIKSIDLTKDGKRVPSDEYVVKTRECPSLTLKMVSVNMSGNYECTISYDDLSQKEVHHLELLVTPKEYEVKIGDKRILFKFLKNLKAIDDVRWTHNNRAIPVDSCFYKGGTQSNPALTVKYCSTSESGLYCCYIKTTQGQKRFSAQLKIKGTGEINVDVGGKIELLENLNIKDKDVIDVDWYHDGNSIPLDWGFVYDVEKKTCAALTINVVASNLKGNYTCIVQSTKDPKPRVFEFQVNVIDNYTVDSGKNIGLLKDLTSYYDIKQISWVLNGKPLKLAENQSYNGGTKVCPVLTVYCATKEESGQYTCRLEFESQLTKELNFKLDVNEQWDVESGKSIVLLDNLGKFFNATSVEWTYKKGQMSCLHTGGTIECPALTIPVVSLKDSGEYECKLTLQHGNIRLYRFVLTVNVQQIKKEVGDKVILLQNLTSAGTIQGINWYKNGRKVPANSDHKYQGGVNKSPGLLVGSLRQDDSGRYECDIITESQIKLHIPVDLTVEKKENSTRLGPIRHNRVHNSTENIQSSTEREK